MPSGSGQILQHGAVAGLTKLVQEQFVETCQKLEKLKLAGLTELVQEQFVETCQKLEKLKL